MADPRRSSGQNVQAASEKVLTEAGTQAVVAGAASVGVPPPLANAVARSKPVQKIIEKRAKKGATAVRGLVKVAKAAAVAAMILPVLIIALLAGAVVSAVTSEGSSPAPQAKASEQALAQTPETYLAVYQRVGERYDVPWTLLAGVGEMTGHGRVDPYGGSNLGPTLATSPTDVVIVGDSLTVGIKGRVEDALSPLPVFVDAIEGRRTAQGVEALRRLDIDPGTIVVVGLGTNDGGTLDLAGDVDEVMLAAGGDAIVLWLNVHLPDPARTAAVNDVLVAAMSRHPNLAVLDWAAVVAADPSLLTSDGIHLTSSVGYPTRAQYIAEAVATLDADARRASSSDSRCPVTDPPIGGVRGGGAGPLLLRPDVLAEAGLGEYSAAELQDLCTSTELLAEHLADLREELEEAVGVDFRSLVRDAANGDLDASAELQAGWSAVLSAMTIVADPTQRAVGCALPDTVGLDDQRRVAVWVQALWRCEVAAGDLPVVTEVTAEGQPVTSSNPVSQVVAEALQVSWWWSQWGATPCDTTAPQAGVFPLDQATFVAYVPAEHSGKDRCDPQANIAAAAAAFAAAERVPVEERPSDPPFAVQVGGWAALPVALGDEATRATFTAGGPWQAPEVTKECADDLPGELRTFAAATSAAGVDPAAATEEQLASLDAELASFVLPESCSALESAEPFARTGTLASSAAIEYRLGVDEFQPDAEGSDTALADTLAVEVLAWRWAALAEASRPGAPTAGVDTLLPRLSPVPRDFTLPLAAPAPRPITTVDLTRRVFDAALRYGGFYLDDPGVNLLTGATAGPAGIGLVIDTSDQHKGQVIDDRSDPELIPGDPACGGGLGRAELIERWNRMCADAVASDVPMRQIGMHRTSADQAALLARRGDWAAPVGTSRHQTGTAVDINVDDTQVLHWLHNVVGCYDLTTQGYFPYRGEVDFKAWAQAARDGAETVADIYGSEQPTCPGQVPVKRIQTYGLLFNICGQRGDPTNLARPEVVECSSSLRYENGQRRVVEDWHAQPGVLLFSTGQVSALSLSACGLDPDANTVNGTFIDPEDPQLLATATYTIFYCLARDAGLDQLPPTPFANGDGPPIFANKAQQVAAEAVVVGFCESSFSAGSATSNNFTGKYGGVFQMGDAEMERFAPGGAAAKFVPVANIVGAARYYLYGHGKAPWDGWGPWAAINTDYGGANDKVVYPALQRFPTTQPGYFGRAPGSLPAWAIDPTAPGFTLPGRCHPAFDLGPWP